MYYKLYSIESFFVVFNSNVAILNQLSAVLTSPALEQTQIQIQI